ncbi:MAG TPA: PqqD family protein [Intrasporangium sp.]|uniref:PqqD family protein n=1 Tax=Intrasporangium sp. TaxID=1925024 RepID=UPI002F956AE5
MRGSAAYGIAPNVGHVDDAGRSYVARLPEGPPMVLEDSAALIWMQVVVGGTVGDIASRVAVVAGISAEDIIGDVETFLDELVAHGVLVRHDV